MIKSQNVAKCPNRNSGSHSFKGKEICELCGASKIETTRAKKIANWKKWAKKHGVERIRNSEKRAKAKELINAGFNTATLLARKMGISIPTAYRYLDRLESKTYEPEEIELFKDLQFL